MIMYQLSVTRWQIYPDASDGSVVRPRADGLQGSGRQHGDVAHRQDFHQVRLEIASLYLFEALVLDNGFTRASASIFSLPFLVRQLIQDL